MFVHAKAALSKREMLADVMRAHPGIEIVESKLAAKNTL
jgi:hypothetical protein